MEMAIDELVLHGFDPHQRAAIGDAVHRELVKALAGWQPDRSATVTHVDGGSFSVPAGAPVPVIGRTIAEQILRALPGPGSQPGNGPRRRV
jgi:hypothetical protein